MKKSWLNRFCIILPAFMTAPMYTQTWCTCFIVFYVFPYQLLLCCIASLSILLLVKAQNIILFESSPNLRDINTHTHTHKKEVNEFELLFLKEFVWLLCFYSMYWNLLKYFNFSSLPFTPSHTQTHFWGYIYQINTWEDMAKYFWWRIIIVRDTSQS